MIENKGRRSSPGERRVMEYRLLFGLVLYGEEMDVVLFILIKLARCLNTTKDGLAGYRGQLREEVFM